MLLLKLLLVFIPSTERRVIRKKLNAFVGLCQGQKKIVWFVAKGQKHIAWCGIKGKEKYLWFSAEESGSIGTFLKLFEVDVLLDKGRLFYEKNVFL
jgi:hypothetical protein